MKGENFDVYDALKPICWISKAFGVFPCKLDGSKSGGLEFGIMLVNLILHSVIFYLSFFHYHVNLNYNRQYLLMSVIENVLDLLCITSCIFNVTLIYKTRRNIFEALRRICAVEMILNSLGGRTDYKPVRNYHIVYFTFHLIVLISLYQGKFFVYFDVTLLPSKATSFLKSVVSALILAGFCTMLFAIRQLCDTLVSLCNPRLICRLYLDICEICKFLTNGYESVLIVQFLGNFAGLLSCTFYIVQAWNGGGTNTELLFQIAWFLFNILKIFVCLKGCVDTTKKVTKNGSSNYNFKSISITGQRPLENRSK